jgi:hypothetical protein
VFIFYEKKLFRASIFRELFHFREQAIPGSDAAEVVLLHVAARGKMAGSPAV